MSEDLSLGAGHTDPTQMEEMRIQQRAIADWAELRVEDTATTDYAANSITTTFGLERGAYDVFTDSEKPFAGGFTKIVSKQDPQDTLIAVAWPHTGGPTHNPNRYVYEQSLKPNGDIIERVSVENNVDVKKYDIDLSANSPDPETAERYRRTLSNMYDAARKLALPTAESSRSAAAVESTRARKGALSGLLGRFSLQ